MEFYGSAQLYHNLKVFLFGDVGSGERKVFSRTFYQDSVQSIGTRMLWFLKQMYLNSTFFQ